jgi:HSP20 family protein
MRQNEVSRRDPFAEMMRSWFDRAFTGLPLEEGQQWIGTLALDVFEKDDQLVVKAAIPGVKPEEVDITIQDDVLTIKGESKEDKEIKREDYYMKETRTGSFTRSIRLPADLDLQSAKADFQDGMLTLSIPKSKDVKPSKIKIPVGGSAAPDTRGGQPS